VFQNKLESPHVIPTEQVKIGVLARGPSGQKLEFNFKSRDEETMIRELGNSLIEISSSSPGGVLVFFTSYLFLD
jgi:chromosome transmission fidelity protein 1